MFSSLWNPQTLQKLQKKKQIAPTVSDVSRPITVRQLSYSVHALQGMGRRSQQQDAYDFVNAGDVIHIRDQGLFAVLADGMGGMSDGQLAGRMAVNIMDETFRDIDRKGDIPGQLSMGLRRASREVYNQLSGRGGTTLVACMCYKERLYACSIGDSSLYIYRNGYIYRAFHRDNVFTEAALLASLQGNLNPLPQDADSFKLTRFTGMPSLTDLQYFHAGMPLLAGDILLLCSDGVSEFLAEGELVQCFQQRLPKAINYTIQQKIEALHDPQQDNYTALTILCQS